MVEVNKRQDGKTRDAKDYERRSNSLRISAGISWKTGNKSRLENTSGRKKMQGESGDGRTINLSTSDIYVLEP